MRQVVVTGMGCVSALGCGTAESWSNIVSGGGGLARASVALEGHAARRVESVVGMVAAPTADLLVGRLGKRAVSGLDPFAQFAALATLEALDDAGLSAGDPALREAAILYGNASGGNVAIEAGYERIFAGSDSVHPLTVPRCMSSAATSSLSMLFGVRGLCYALSSACASSAHAISEGMHLIRSGRADLVLVGGSDASLTYGLLQSWRALQAISAEACRPFSADRDGTVIGEGAATLILEARDHASARGATIRCEILGAGFSSDAGHLTQPDVNSAARAMRRAHDDAGVPLDAPLLISSHGTGTLLNDRAEAAALRLTYGANLGGSKVIATKSAHGHMLGATGAIEMILAILALEHRVAPPLRGFTAHDADSRDLPLALQLEPFDTDLAMSMSLAFGGLNCALLARRWSG